VLIEFGMQNISKTTESTINIKNISDKICFFHFVIMQQNKDTNSISNSLRRLTGFSEIEK
jgi:hypothetical protein